MPIKSTDISPRRAPAPLILLCFLTLIGVGTSVALTQHFYEVRNGSAGFKSFCNVGQTLNCDVVAASPSAELISGLPLSSFASGWYLAFFMILLFAFNPYWRREAVRASLVLSVFGVLFSCVYLFIMAVQLKTLCLLCLVVDAINLLSLILVLCLKPEGFSQHKADRSKWKVFAGITLGSLILSVFLLRSLDELSIPSSTINEMSDVVLNTPAVSVRATEDLPSFGPLSAPITIVEFSDFQCPWCRMAAFSINSMVNRYPGKIRVVFRNYPLDSSCNHNVQQSMHPYACEAARAALCGHKIGKFEMVYQDLFEKQSLITSGKLSDILSSSSLDSVRLKECMTSPDTTSEITRDIQDGETLGIKSTPTFFINGHKMEGALPAPVWAKIIDHILGYK